MATFYRVTVNIKEYSHDAQQECDLPSVSGSVPRGSRRHASLHQPVRWWQAPGRSHLRLPAARHLA